MKRMDVSGGRDKEGNNVQVHKKNGTPAQKWKIVYEDKAKDIKTEGFADDYGMKIGKPFYIQSVMPMRRVITCHGAHHVRVNNVDPNRNRRSQHWTYDNVSKTIKNVQWPNRSLTISGRNVITQPTNSRWNQMWSYEKPHMINTHGMVLDIATRHGRDFENANIIAHRKHNGVNQHFEIIYVDEMPAEPKKGELNTQFNLIVEKPFYVVSGLQSGRYLDILGRNMVIKTRNGRDSQLWYFDQRSRTIKSWFRKGWSWDIHGGGRHRNMQAWNTNSGWW
jgi:hypothetical protein